MTNYKEILRLHSMGINNTRIAESCSCVQLDGYTCFSGKSRASSSASEDAANEAYESPRSLRAAVILRTVFRAQPQLADIWAWLKPNPICLMISLY